MYIPIKKLNNLAKTPTRGSQESAGYDLYAATDYEIQINPHSTIKIGTGISMALPHDSFAAIFARSGMATKQGLRPANCVGICDADYRGEYIVALHNDTDEPQYIPPGARIAQVVLLPFISMDFVEQDELNETERGEGGFGSTGE